MRWMYNYWTAPARIKCQKRMRGQIQYRKCAKSKRMDYIHPKVVKKKTTCIFFFSCLLIFSNSSPSCRFSNDNEPFLEPFF